MSRARNLGPATVFRLTLATVLAGSCLDFASLPQTLKDARESPRSGFFTPLGVQLHVHGLSNHNSAGPPGSMQWQVALAAREGLKAIWWSEHGNIFSQPFDFPIHLEQATVSPSYSVAFAATQDPPYQRVGALVGSWSGGTPVVDLQSGVLTVGIDPAATGTLARYDLRVTSAYDQSPLIQTSLFARPTIGHPALLLDLALRDTAEGGVFRVVLDLAGHLASTAQMQRLVYELGPRLAADTAATGDTLVRIRIPFRASAGVFQSLVLDLTPPRGLIRDGDDNTVSGLTLGVESDSGPTRFVVRNLRLTSLEQNAVHTFEAARVLAARYEARYGIVQPVGIEEHRFSDRMPNGEPPHANAFLPFSSDVPTVVTTAPSTLASFVDAVHSAGGLVSLNHPFGTSPSGSSGGVQIARVLALADHLDSVHAWGVDLLETGYPQRGFANIGDHLALWDELARRGLRLCGVGSSDSHGGEPTDAGQFGRFATWVWVTDASQDGILAGLRHCAAYFGDAFYWSGTLDLRVNDVYAGSRLGVVGDSVRVEVYMTTEPTSRTVGPFQLFLVKVTSHDVQHLPIAIGEPVGMPITDVILVRVEMWTTERRPIAFSNPVWFSRLTQPGSP